MLTLCKYEFLKIVRKKSTLIVMGVSLLITTLLFGLPISQHQVYYQEGMIPGLAGIAYEKEQTTKYTVLLSEDYIANTINEYQKLFDDPENVGYDGNEEFIIGDAYWQYVAPQEKLLMMIAANYNQPGEYTGINKLRDVDLTAGANFYQTRESKIYALLTTPSRRLSDEQKSFWLKMNSKVATPFGYGYCEGWKTLLTSTELLVLAIFAICIVVTPVFAGEYQAGTDALLLSAKYGKTKLISAKVAAVFIFGLLTFTLHVLVACGLPLWSFGLDGWDLPVQIVNTSIPYPFTFQQAVMVNVAIIYCVLLALLSLTMCLSASMKNSYLVLGVLTAVVFLPVFLSPTDTAGIYNTILFLLPYRSTMLELNKYISYQFGSVVIDVHMLRIILYVVFTVLLLPLTRSSFRRHQAAE